MKFLDWHEKDTRVGGRSLSNFRFADEVVPFSNSSAEAENMLAQGRRIGLRTNQRKTEFKKDANCERKGDLTGRLSAYRRHLMCTLDTRRTTFRRKSQFKYNVTGRKKEFKRKPHVSSIHFPASTSGDWRIWRRRLSTSCMDTFLTSQEGSRLSSGYNYLTRSNPSRINSNRWSREICTKTVFIALKTMVHGV